MTHDPKPLSPRHELFVAEYLKDFNATQAYIRAGYSEYGAQQSASRLLAQPAVAAAVDAARQRLLAALGGAARRITGEYARIAFANVGDFVGTDADGKLRIDLEKAAQAQRAGILELKVATNSKGQQTITLKLGKLQALAALSKQLGIDKPKPAARDDDLALDVDAANLRRWEEIAPPQPEPQPQFPPDVAESVAPPDP
jgi:phage terminase small subunit